MCLGRGYQIDCALKWLFPVSRQKMVHQRRVTMKKMIIFLMVFFFVFSYNGLLFAKDDSSGVLSPPEVVGDVLWVRPLGFMHLALGATAFVLSLPVTIPLKKTDEAKEFLLTYPYYYYSKRPLGEM
jgi:hypothetical protein